jgi:hypothetical protein
VRPCLSVANRRRASFSFLFSADLGSLRAFLSHQTLKGRRAAEYQQPVSTSLRTGVWYMNMDDHSEVLSSMLKQLVHHFLLHCGSLNVIQNLRPQVPLVHHRELPGRETPTSPILLYRLETFEEADAPASPRLLVLIDGEDRSVGRVRGFFCASSRARGIQHCRILSTIAYRRNMISLTFSRPSSHIKICLISHQRRVVTSSCGS